MSSKLQVELTAPFDVGDLTASVETKDDDEILVVLRDGRFDGELTDRPSKLRLTTLPAPEGEAPLRFPNGERPNKPKGEPVSLHALFEHGCAVPADGRLTLQLRWGTPCHTEALPDEPARKRFASWEHVICGRYVGMDSVSEHAARLEIAGNPAPFDSDTKLPVGGSELTFGEIICLAGDFYAHLDSRAAGDFSWAWPPMPGFAGWLAGDYRATTLSEDESPNVRNLLGVIERDKDEDRGAAGEFVAAALDAANHDYPARRYLALASQNYCHFACPEPGDAPHSNVALRLYRAYHERAVAEAAAAVRATVSKRALFRALATDAFGCHFLTDLFASGHMRVPRRLLGERYGIPLGSLHMSHSMHAEDNSFGLWVTTANPNGNGRVVWRSYGDGMLRKDIAETHLTRVQEAVRRSAAEIFAAYSEVQVPVGERAEEMVPTPLPPGVAPRPNDTLPDGRAVSDATPNHYPLYWFRSTTDATIMHRKGGPNDNLYEPVFDLLTVPAPLPREVLA